MVDTIDARVPVLRRNLMSHLMVPGDDMPVVRRSAASHPAPPSNNLMAMVLDRIQKQDETIAELRLALQAAQQAPVVVYSPPQDYVPEPLPTFERRHKPARLKREGVLRRLARAMAD